MQSGVLSCEHYDRRIVATRRPSETADSPERAAVDERDEAIFDPESNTTPLDRAVHELVVSIPRVHHDGDGCLDHEP